MGNSAIQQILATTDEKVKASLTDNTPDFLDGKVDGTSVDVNGSDKLAVLPAGVDHNSLNNYDANKHVDHTTVTITAGAGLSGGGTIAANRTIDVDINSEVDTVITASDQILFADATDSNAIKKDTVQGILDLVPAASGIPSNIQVFTSSGTWTKPVGVSKVWVRLWGAGGDGGYNGAQQNGGGGGGGYCEGLVNVSGNVTVTVGTNTSSSDSDPQPGTASVFAGDSTLTANGGQAGSGSSGGSGGTATGGTLNITGQDGADVVNNLTVGGGAGGGSPMGGAGGQNQCGNGNIKNNGGFPGGGGSGGSNNGGYGHGQGANGLVIVMY